MNYRFKKGSYIKADAQTAGEICEKLEQQGNLTARALLEESRPENAPLHNAFEWDDGKAAELYRENQARHIISSLEIVPVQSEPVRAFFNIVRSEPQYTHINVLMNQKETAEMLLKYALNELLAFQRKYSQLVELAKVFDAIDEVTKISA